MATNLNGSVIVAISLPAPELVMDRLEMIAAFSTFNRLKEVLKMIGEVVFAAIPQRAMVTKAPLIERLDHSVSSPSSSSPRSRSPPVLLARQEIP
jgi:hypothetical protein